jgi:diguanylate cyclase (GGDEF)-like protein
VGVLAILSLLPVVALLSALYLRALPLLGPARETADLRGIHALAALAVLLALAAAVGAWRLAAAPGRPPARERAVPAPAEESPGGADEVGTVLSSFSRILTTIEQQTGELGRYTDRLNTAYEELDSTSARLKELSFTDEVTGLYNRRFFTVRLEEELSRYRRFAHPVSLILLDLDDFKAINDRLGHLAGDETLQGMADILARNSRGINVLARYGGDEFAVLLVETPKAGARLYAERIRQLLAARAFPHGRRVTASFGVATIPEDVPPAAEPLIRAADEALYAAKRAGRNRVSVYAAAGAEALAPAREKR